MNVAYDRLAQKWAHYFERGDDEDAGDRSAHSAHQPTAGGGGRPSLFSKMGMRSSHSSKPARDRVSWTMNAEWGAHPCMHGLESCWVNPVWTSLWRVACSRNHMGTVLLFPVP